MYKKDAAARRGERVYLIDALRGASILLMVIYHLAFNLTHAGLFPGAVFYHPVIRFLQPVFAGLFIAICGFSCFFSRNNKKRGGVLVLCAIAVSAVTWFLPSSRIVFGILHFLGVSILLFCLVKPLIDKISVKVQPFFFVTLYAISAFVLQWINSPAHIKENPNWLAPLGIVYPGFFSADFFPLLPWFFIFLFGTWVGRIAKAGFLPAFFYTVRCGWLEAIGRHTLAIYLLHQPVILGILFLIQRVK